MAGMDDILIEIKGKAADVLAAVAEAEAALKSLGNETEKTSTRTSTSTKNAGRDVEDFGRTVVTNMRDGETAFSKMGTSVEGLKSKMSGLKSDFARIGRDAGQAFSTGLESAMSNPMSGGAVAAVGVIGPAIAAAVTAGVGLGILGIGGWLESHNSQVMTPFAVMKRDIVDELQSAADEALTVPFQNAITSIDQEFTTLGPNLKALFASVAPAVEPLVKDLNYLLSTIMPGLVDLGGAFSKVMASPVVTASLDALAQAVDNLFSNIASNSNEVKDGISGLVTLLTGLVYIIDALVTVGGALDWMMRQEATAVGNFVLALQGVDTSTQDATPHAAAFATSVASMGQQIAVTTGDMPALTGEIKNQTVSIDAIVTSIGSWDKAFKEINGEALNMEQAAEGMAAALDSFTLAVKANGRSLDIGTAKGRANRATVVDGIRAAEALAQAKWDETHSVSAATKVYDANIAKLEAAAVKAGFNRHQIELMITALSKIPKSWTTVVTTVFKTTGARFGPGGGRGTPTAQLFGGVDYAGVRAFANAGVAEGDGQGLIKFAEAATLREAFIPERGDRNRSVATLREAAGWNDMDVVPRGGYTHPVAAPVAYVPIVVNLGGVHLATIHAQLIPVVQKFRERNAGRSGFD